MYYFVFDLKNYLTNQCFSCFKENWIIAQTPVKLTWRDKSVVVTFPITKKNKETQGSLVVNMLLTHVQIEVSEIFFQMERCVHLKYKVIMETKGGVGYSDYF